MAQLKDSDLVSKSIHGDMKAFGVLIDRYKQMVFTLACRMLRNKEDAEEIAQDTFLKAYKALNTFKGDAKFSTWLYKIAYFQSLDQLKKKKRLITSISLDRYKPTDIKVMSGILEELERQDRASIVKAAIDRLSEEDAAIVTLFYFEELSIREIAEIVSLSPQVIKVRLFRSRKQLAIYLSTSLLKEKVTNYEH
ncbi:sigma-70 family RNA polymerase sigma factor [uncultured Muriicola sp.]|uniref:RNA polymerase sigma factor n=1 Tax=uncultured Muriicola sp. TaxID=1583102 RepID=UPI00261E66C5|nr:sigma-70 family RNA polymerase sigma factor [uncultured Muriicola sp.]